LLALRDIVAASRDEAPLLGTNQIEMKVEVRGVIDRARWMAVGIPIDAGVIERQKRNVGWKLNDVLHHPDHARSGSRRQAFQRGFGEGDTQRNGLIGLVEAHPRARRAMTKRYDLAQDGVAVDSLGCR